MAGRVFIGADIHSQSAILAVYHAGKGQLSSLLMNPEFRRVENRKEEFIKFAAYIRGLCPETGKVAVLLEASSVGSLAPIVHFFEREGYCLFQIRDAIVGETRSRLFGKESKTDRVDAATLGLILHHHQVFGIQFPVRPVSSSSLGRERVLRMLVSQRWALIKTRTQITLRLGRLIKAVFPEAERKFHQTLLRILPEAPVPEDLVRLERRGALKLPGMPKARKDELLSLAKGTVGIPGAHLRSVIQVLAQLRRDIDAQCRRLEALLNAAVKADSAHTVLMSFPGMGTVTAATLLGVIGDIGRWKSLAAFRKGMGVYGEVLQSGNASLVVRRGRGGSRSAKRVLYQLVVLSLSPHVPDNDFRDYFRRQMARGKNRRKAMYSTMSKLAKIVYYCLREGVPYEYQNKKRPCSSHRRGEMR